MDDGLSRPRRAGVLAAGLGLSVPPEALAQTPPAPAAATVVCESSLGLPVIDVFAPLATKCVREFS